jgi:hypothetical protein
MQAASLTARQSHSSSNPMTVFVWAVATVTSYNRREGKATSLLVRRKYKHKTLAAHKSEPFEQLCVPNYKRTGRQRGHFDSTPKTVVALSWAVSTLCKGHSHHCQVPLYVSQSRDDGSRSNPGRILTSSLR